MKIGVVDADLIGRKRHRFPNLCCMKISGYHKSLGDEVQLVLDCSDLSCFDNEVAHKNGAAGECKSLRTAKDFLNEYPEIANYYFNIKWKVWE